MWAFNFQNWVPIHKFKGVPKDSTLLYLEKYLLKLANSSDVTEEIERDIINGIQKHKSMPKANTFEDL